MAIAYFYVSTDTMPLSWVGAISIRKTKPTIKNKSVVYFDCCSITVNTGIYLSHRLLAVTNEYAGEL